MRDLQAEHKAWLATMYPGQPQDIPAAGMIEEAAELLHAVLAQRRAAIWGQESRYPQQELQRKVVDAIGDCAIYVCSFCNAAEMSFQQFFGRLVPTDDPVRSAVQLVEAATKHFDSLGNVYLLSTYMAILRGISDYYDLDFTTAIRQTWDGVKRRIR